MSKKKREDVRKKERMYVSQSKQENQERLVREKEGGERWIELRTVSKCTGG